MKTYFTKLLVCGLLVGISRLAAAQTIYNPVPNLTGFTADVVADGAGPAANSTTAAFDQGGTDVPYCLVGPTYVSPVAGAATRSLPTNGILQNSASTTPDLLFKLQLYAGLNSVRIAGTGTGSLTLATPQAAQSVWVAAAMGNGAPSGNNPVTMTVVFTDGTTQVFTPNVSDWFGGANYVANNLGRVGRPTDRFDNTVGEPRIYQLELPLLAANYNKLVSSVQFAKTQPAGVATATVFNGLAITLASACRIPALAAQATPTAACPGQAVQLGLLVTGNGMGYAGQWQSSPDGITWTDLPGGINASLTVTPAVTTLYRYRASCNTSSALSNTVTVTVTSPTATLAYGASSYCRTGSSGRPTATPAGGTFSAPAGLSLNTTTGEINLAASAAGTYAVAYVSGGVCPATATATVTVAPSVATLAYGAASYCRTGSSSAPAVTPAGGTFSAPAGLVINASTGVLNLEASAPGTYTVTYASGGQCPATATATVTVVQPTALLAYGNSTFCRVGSSGVPAAAPAGGTFSAPAGLVLNANTGEINLAASTAGAYTVSYTSGGQCPATATTAVLIKSDALPTFPNVLTPNGDNANDELHLRFAYPADVAGFRMQVFNRWGRGVFETGNPTQGWTTSGCSAGLYYYVVEYLDCASRRQYYKGWVEVLK